MNVILFGGTGMVGQGVLRECLRDPDVTQVIAVLRSGTGQQHPKLRELVHDDFGRRSKAPVPSRCCSRARDRGCDRDGERDGDNGERCPRRHLDDLAQQHFPADERQDGGEREIEIAEAIHRSRQ